MDVQSPSPVASIPATGEEYALNPHLDVLVCSEDEVRIKQGTWSDRTLTLHDDDRRGILGPVFSELLLAARTGDELRSSPGVDARVSAGDLADFLDEMVRSGVLVPAPGGVVRHPPAALGGPHPAAAPPSSVALVGDGATAVQLRRYLADAGVATGPVGLLGRHDPALNAGAADGAADDEVRRWPGSPSDAVEAACGAGDVLVVALDSFSPATLNAANAVALARDTPWVSTYCDGPLVVVGPIYVPGDTGCYAEFETQLLAVCSRRPEKQAFWDVLEDRTAPRRSPRWHGGLAAGWLMEPLLEFLTSGASDLVGRATVFDTAQRRTEHVRCLTLPRCPVCRGDRGGHHPWD